MLALWAPLSWKRGAVSYMWYSTSPKSSPKERTLKLFRTLSFGEGRVRSSAYFTKWPIVTIRACRCSMVWTTKFIRCIVNSFSILVSDLWFKYAHTTPPPLAVFGEGGKTIGKWGEIADEWNTRWCHCERSVAIARRKAACTVRDCFVPRNDMMD